MEIIIALIALVGLIILGSRMTRNESERSTSAPQSDDQQESAKYGARADFDRLFSGYTETDRSDALRMCQKRMDIGRDEAINRLVHKPALLREMLRYARMEAETKRLD
jgi:CBS-domain-containing membrane protein